MSRLTLIISILFGFGVGMFIAGFDRFSPSIAFLEYGWIISIIATVAMKQLLFSEDQINAVIQNFSTDLKEEILGSSEIVSATEDFASNQREGGNGVMVLDSKDVQSNQPLPEGVVLPEGIVLSESEVVPRGEVAPRGESVSEGKIVTECEEISVGEESSIHTPIPTQKEEFIEEVKDTSPNFLTAFFADRPLAKIGGILLITGAIFFMSIIWKALEVEYKVGAGILFGTILYGIGFLINKPGSYIESRTLMGTGLVINSVTILFARWLLKIDGVPLLSEWTALFLLLINLAVAGFTGLRYSSGAFLFFSYVFGYSVPFLVGIQFDTFHVLFGYGFLLTTSLYGVIYFGATALKDWLMKIGIVGSIILTLLSSWIIESIPDLYTFLFLLIVLVAFGIFISHKRLENLYTDHVIFGGYIGLIIFAGGNISHMSGMQPISGISNAITATLFAIVALFAMTVWSILARTRCFADTKDLKDSADLVNAMDIPCATDTNNSNNAPVATISGIDFKYSSLTPVLLSLPLIFSILLLARYNNSNMQLIVLTMTGLYIVASYLLSFKNKGHFYGFLTIGIGVFLIAVSIVYLVTGVHQVSNQVLFTLVGSIGLFCIYGFWNIVVYKDVRMLPIVQGLTSCVLILVLKDNWEYSWWVVGVFALIGGLVPYFLKQAKAAESYQLPLFINIFFGWILLEISILGNSSLTSRELSYAYFGVGAISIISIYSWIEEIFEKRILDFFQYSDLQKNIFMSIMIAPIAILSIATAIYFTDSPETSSIIYLVISAFFTYLYRLTRSEVVFNISFLLLLSGIFGFSTYSLHILMGDYASFGPIILATIALMFGLKSFPRTAGFKQHLYDVVYLVGMTIVCNSTLNVFPQTNMEGEFLVLGFYCLILAESYRVSQSRIIQVYTGMALLYYFVQILGMSSKIDTWSEFIVGVSSALLVLFGGFRSKGMVFGISSIIFLAVTTMIVDAYLMNTFIATLYLASVSAGLLMPGILLNISRIRTAGLYVGVVVLGKILFFDIWYEFDDAIARVLVLMICGGLMIWLSQLYGKMIRRKWSEEFSPVNFFPEESGFLEGVSQEVVSQEVGFQEKLSQ